ncbi:Calx-beta domain-containing protein [Actinoplanes sp. NPDC051861]|uniref:Calx-beta domain-containing protein n=1 Tax=Actinoplanes sp. NPDC051861 TaxID=3155170 RepID=UPI003413B81B
MRDRPRHRADVQIPLRLWAPSRFRAFVSVVAAAAAGLIPTVALPPTPAWADPGDIIIEADIEDAEAGTFTFEIRRVGPIGTPFTLNYQTAPVPNAAHPATSGVDFTPISGSTTFTASSRDSIKRITVTGLTDQNDEYDEVFGLSLTNVNDPLNNLAIGTLSDDDAPPTYSFGAAATVGEGDGSVTATATLSAASDFPVSIPYTTTDGTATDPQDYTATAGTLSFAPGDDAEDVVVSINDDNRDETGTETFTVDTGTPTNATLTPASKTVNITDNDTPPEVSVDPLTQVAEGDPAIFTVRLNAASNLPVDVTATIAGTGGATGGGGDFTAATPQTVTIPAGSTSVTVSVPTTGDGLSESGEGVSLTLSSPVNATLGAGNATTATIVDNALTVTADTAITEGNSGTRNQTFTVTLPVAPQNSTPVSYAVNSGTATAGTDFDTVSAGTLTFGPGVTTQQITVPIRGDTVYESGGEAFDIVLSDPGTSTLSGFGTFPFTIVEDDVAPALLSLSSISRPEAGGSNSAEFVATLDHASSQNIVLDVVATDTGGADADPIGGPGGDDYDLDSATLTIPAGSITGSVTVTVKGDAVYEVDETLTLTATRQNAGATGGPVTGTLTLENDDTVPTISLAGLGSGEGVADVALSADVTGEAEDSLPFTATATGAANNSGSDPAEGTDFDDADLNASGTLTPGSLTLDLGEIDIEDDQVDENPETIQIAVTMDGSTVSDYVTVSDAGNDLPPEVSIDPTATVVEDAGPAEIPVNLNYAHDGNNATSTEKTIVANYSAAASGTASSGDLTVGTGSVSFAPTDPLTKDATVDVTADSDYELDETFSVTLTTTSEASGIAAGADASTVTIDDDDDPPGFSVSADETVTEGGFAQFTVTLDSPAVSYIDFTAVMSDGSTSGSDYTPPAGTFQIEPGQTFETFNVPIIDDTADEAAETATLTVSLDGSEPDAAGSPVARSINITDNDDPPELAVLTPITGAEGETKAIAATVIGSAQASVPYTATVTGVGGTAAVPGLTNAVQDADVDGSGLTLSGTLTPSAPTLTVGNLVLEDDQIDEDAQTAEVSIALAGQDPVTTTVTISDNADDLPPEASIAASASVAEDGGSAAVPVTLDFAHDGNDASSTEKTIDVNFNAATGTATSGDFTTGAGSVSFAPTDPLTKNASVAITDDDDYELSETFTVDLTTAPLASGIDGTADSSTVTITNDDTAPGFTVTPDETVAEDGTASFTVTLDAPAVSTIDFTAVMSNVTTTGGDYSAPAGTFQISATQSTATVNIPAVDDTADEADETATLTIDLDGSENDATGGPIARTITITDNDDPPTIALAPITGAEGETKAISATVTGSSQAPVAYTATVTGVGGTAAVPGLTNAVQDADVDGSGLTLTGNLAPGSGTLNLGNLVLEDDQIDEDAQTAQVSITLAGQQPVTTTVTISDNADDLPPEASIDPTATVAENAGPALIPVNLDFAHDGNDASSTEKTVVVNFDAATGSAAADDFTTGAGSVSFAPTDPLTKNASVAITTDDDYELSETFTVDLTTAPLASGIDGTADSSTVTITNDDTAPGFTVTPDETVAEDGTASFTVTLDAPAVSTIDFTAVMSNVTTTGGDYSAPPGTFQISATQTTATVNVPAVDDTADEADETATLTIDLDGSENDATGGPIARTITITDNDDPPTVALSPITGAEGETKAISATVTGSAQAPVAYTATVTGVGGTAAVPGLTNAVQDADVDGSGLTLTGNLAPGSGTLNLGNLVLEDDQIDEDAQTAEVSITLAGQQPVTTTVTISDNADDLPPEASIAASASVAEDGGSAAVPVTLDFAHDGNDASSTEKTVVVNFDAATGSAAADDFTTGAGSVSFAPTDPLTKNASVAITDDDDYELSETFTVDLTTAPLASGIDGTADSSTVTITNDDTAPGFTVTPDETVAEDGTASFTVTLDAPAVSTIDFTAVMANVSTTGGDYTAPPGTFQIPATQTTATVNVPAVDDTADEADETATLTIDLDGSENDATGGPIARTVTITDNDDPPTIALAPITGAEGETKAISATVTGSAQAPVAYTATVTGVAGTTAAPGMTNPVQAADVDGSGLTLTGNLAPGSGTLNLGNLVLAGDAIDEEDQTAQVSITLAGQQPVTTTVTISDDTNNQTPRIVFGAAPTVAEEAGTATVPVGLSWAGLGGNTATSTEKTITVRADTADDSATQPSDYAAVVNRTVTFLPGDVAEDVVVTVADDQAHELTEQFDVGLSAPSGDATVPVADTAVTITDSDAKPTYTVSSETVNEGGTATVTVTLGAPAADDIPMTVSMVDGTATLAGTDFSTPTAALTVDKGTSTATVQVASLNDDLYEGPESATVRVTRDNDDHAAGGPVDGTLTISDTDPVPVITLNTVEDAEGATVNVTATPDGVAQRTMNYTLAAAGDSGGGANPAESGDFTASLTGVSIPGGSPAGVPVALGTIGLNADAVDEATETVKVTAHNDDAATADVSSTYRVTDDPADLPPAVSLGPVSVSEAAGYADVPVSLAYGGGNAATSTEQAVSVNYLIIPGTAGLGDFGPTASPNPLVIAAGTANAVVRVPIVNDSAAEESESFQVVATQAGPAGATISTAAGTVTVFDNDEAGSDGGGTPGGGTPGGGAPGTGVPAFSVASTASTVEGSGPATVEVTLDAAASNDVDFTVTAADGTATDAATGPGGDDYDAPATTLRIPKGSLGATVTIPVRQDAVYEGNENARITVALAAGERDASGAAQSSAVTVTDDDPRPTLDLIAVTAAEGESIEVRGTVTGTAQRDLDLDDTTAAAEDGTDDSAEPADYDLTGLNTVLRANTPSGSGINLGTIRLGDDSVDEDTETIPFGVGGARVAYRITDDPDDVAPTVSISDADTRESAGAVELTVSLTFTGGTTGTERSIAVPWRTIAGTADAGKDFTASSGTVRFTPPVTATTISVPLLKDNRNESEQEFTVQLSRAQPADVAVTKSTGTVTVADDDKPKAPTLNMPSAVTGTQRVAVTGAAGAGAKVEMLSAPGPSGGTWRVVYTTTADDNGDFSFKPNFTMGYRVQVRSAGLTSPVRVIQVRQEPTVAASSTSRGTASVTVTGDPDRAGQTVTVQRQSGGNWQTVATGRLDSDGTYSTTQRSLRSGSTYTFRAVVAATPSLGILAGVSPTRQVRIR